MKFQSNAQHNAYNQEWAYVQGRKFLLILLALGSLLVTFRIGGYVGHLLFTHSPTGVMTIRVAFVMLGWAGIDWVLANALASASSISDQKEDPLVLIDEDTGEEIILEQEEKEGETKRSVWFFALFALFTTIGLSVVSNFFISADMAGGSHLQTFNTQVIAAMKQDSLLKSRAFDVLETAGEDERQRLKDARVERKNLIAQAVATGSASWQRDYRKQKNQPRAWFWTCKGGPGCPYGYRRYRERIKDAIRAGDNLVAAARGHTDSLQAILSPTLSYQMDEDSVLLFVRENVLGLEQERKSREQQLNIILMVLTIGAGILSLILTFVLKEHRKQHTQQVLEDHVRPVMVAVDMIDRFGSGLSDLVYTFIAQPFNWFKRKGYIKSYQIQDKRLTVGEHATVGKAVNVERVRTCLNGCGTDISHKRSDAKFCSDECRMNYHNFVPRKKSSTA